MYPSVEKGAIVLSGKYHERADYHVSNEKISVIFNGTGAITGYSEANVKDYISQGFCAIHENGKPVDVFNYKRIEMLGREQKIEVKLNNGELLINQFLDIDTNGVFITYEITGDDTTVDIALMNNAIKDMKVVSFGNVRVVLENSSINIKLNKDTKVAKLLLTFDEKTAKEFNIEKFTEVYNNLRFEFEDIRLPHGLTEIEKAIFYNTYYCALENYKNAHNFKGFMAGHKYLLPMRSYYRDSYYTVLPMYNGHTDKVREQILTLAKGILDDGRCPSAVKFDYSPWWIGHYDSPSFFVIMLYDYIKHTKDDWFLREEVNGVKLYDLAVKVMDKLAEKEKDYNLLYKDGNYNKCDWADEVNRNGYVTYNNILYARALKCISNMSIDWYKNSGNYERFIDKYCKVLHSLNTYLWDDEKGQYVNYRTEDFIEDNLSIDTVLAVNFGLLTGEKAERLLKNMERTLECKNNRNIKVNNFGVACVYPLYSGVESAYNKSSQPYDYHNGANWPYLTAMYAHAKRMYNMEYRNILTDWFIQNIEKNNFTPVEYYSSICKDGSMLQAWDGCIAFVLDEKLSKNFWV